MTRANIADELVELARDRFQFHRNSDNSAFATWAEFESRWHQGERQTRSSGKPWHIAYDLRGTLGLRQMLAAAYYERHQRTANAGAVATALLTIEGSTLEMEVEPTALRVAQRPWNEAHDRPSTWCHLIDLGREDGRLVMLAEGAWSVLDDPGDAWDPLVYFHRTVLTSEMPLPQSGGSIDLLWQHLNIPEEDRAVVLAWLVAALVADIPHPVLVLEGEAGTAKTAMARRLVDLLDPQEPAVRKPPRDVEAWVTAAAGSWVVAIDNVSTISAEFSDSLCRAVTGDGDVRRALYTDGGLATFAFRRVVILTTIGTDAEYRGDLADRMVLCQLSTIEPEARRPEQELDDQWARDRPKILGALLDIAAQALHLLPGVKVAGSPRMADFAKVIQAVDQVQGTTALARYRGQTSALAANSLSGDPFIRALGGSDIDGDYTVAELLKTVAKPDGAHPWPSSSKAAATLLRRNAGALRAQGWTLREEGMRNGSKVWRLRSPTNAIDLSGASTGPHPTGM